MITLKNKILASALIAGLLVFASIFALSIRQEKAIGSVQVGNQYRSTTTPAVADLANLCPAKPTGQASSTTGVLGSVNILAGGGGILAIYDATTTDSTLRSADQATSTLRLADFQLAPTAGSYHFDIEFKRGLLVDYSNVGTGVASSTISFRCEG